MKKAIINNLIKRGYHVSEKETRPAVIFAGIKGEEGPIPDTFVINSAFTIFITDSAIEVVLMNSIVSDRQKFTNWRDLMAYLEEAVPVDN